MIQSNSENFHPAETVLETKQIWQEPEYVTILLLYPLAKYVPI